MKFFFVLLDSVVSAVFVLKLVLLLYHCARTTAKGALSLVSERVSAGQLGVPAIVYRAVGSMCVHAGGSSVQAALGTHDKR